nr:MAG TPA: hypothetical protein [Caudoviricetes sp.]
MEDQKKKLNEILTNVLKILGGLIVLGVVAIIVLNVLYSNKTGEKDPLAPDMLVTFSKQAVKEHLKSPSSAEFPSDESKYSVSYDEEKNTFTVYGSVEAQNALGVLLKNDYVVIGKYDKEKKQYIEISTDIS